MKKLALIPLVVAAFVLPAATATAAPNDAARLPSTGSGYADGFLNDWASIIPDILRGHPECILPDAIGSSYIQAPCGPGPI